MVKLDSVFKHFGTRTVIDNLSFSVGQGKLFGLLGPNGAGKTTTINMIIGALKPDAGTIHINGDGNPQQQRIRRLLGVVPQT
ncbi:MAG TPA: ATP-binding cassette domain-containing protein, partial [Ohtaekwangia sp.]|nr:ATP-binding cassette domain-containing protein [Ohtaekwangia sp.]